MEAILYRMDTIERLLTFLIILVIARFFMWELVKLIAKFANDTMEEEEDE